MKISHIKALLLLALAFSAGFSQAMEVNGNIALQYKNFPQSASFPGQKQDYPSFSATLELYQSLGQNSSFAAKLFARAGDPDSQRNHNDIREAYYLYASDNWELRIGIDKVYWGVTESRHLVDVINQSDLVESFDGEEKLGQNMIHYTQISDNGNWDFFILPGFRQPDYPSSTGRPYFPVDQSLTRYQASDGKNHTDYAIRWSNSIGDWDIGISHFNGTNREAIYQPSNTPTKLPLSTYYEQMQQTGLDLQFTDEELIWKLEAIDRQLDSGNYQAAVAGIESTLIGIMESDTDLGLIAEAMWDSRGQTINSPFQKDLMLGLRFTMNDAQSSEALLGMIYDLDSEAIIYTLEASRRIADSFKLKLQARSYENTNNDPFLRFIKQDAYLQLDLKWYF